MGRLKKELDEDCYIGKKLMGDREIISINSNNSNFLNDYTFGIICSCCRKKSEYSYSTIKKMIEGKYVGECKHCFARAKLKKSIEAYKSRVGKIYNIQKILKCIKFNPDTDRSKYLCECLNCGNIQIKSMNSLRPKSKNPATQCNKCPDKTKPGGYNFPKNVDLTGLKFGIFTVLRYSHATKAGRIWETKCKCGEISLRRTGDLSRIYIGDTRNSCRNCMSLFKSKYTVGTTTTNGDKIIGLDFEKRLVTFLCSGCNNEHKIGFEHLIERVQKNTKHCRSCSRITHGESSSKLYMGWTNTIYLLNKKNIPYDSKWDDYLLFKEDMSDTYIEGYQLESYNGIWNKQNCYWALKDMKNRRKFSNFRDEE